MSDVRVIIEDDEGGADAEAKVAVERYLKAGDLADLFPKET